VKYYSKKKHVEGNYFPKNCYTASMIFDSYGPDKFCRNVMPRGTETIFG